VNFDILSENFVDPFGDICLSGPIFHYISETVALEAITVGKKDNFEEKKCPLND